MAVEFNFIVPIFSINANYFYFELLISLHIFYHYSLYYAELDVQ